MRPGATDVADPRTNASPANVRMHRQTGGGSRSFPTTPILDINMQADKSGGTALLIIDMMNLFDYEGGNALGRSALACLPPIGRLRQRFARASAPIIYVNDNFSQWQCGFPELVARCRMAGGPSRKIATSIPPGHGHYHVLKPKHSAFLCTPLAVLLAKLETRRLVLTGIAMDSCVMATALDANMREFELWVPNDAVGAISQNRKSSALALIRSSMNVVTRGTRAVDGIFP